MSPKSMQNAAKFQKIYAERSKMTPLLPYSPSITLQRLAKLRMGRFRLDALRERFGSVQGAFFERPRPGDVASATSPGRG